MGPGAWGRGGGRTDGDTERETEGPLRRNRATAGLVAGVGGARDQSVPLATASSCGTVPRKTVCGHLAHGLEGETQGLPVSTSCCMNRAQVGRSRSAEEWAKRHPRREVQGP